MVDFPLVSVAIITYNQKTFLRECIDSVLDQDYPNIEIVVADDASNDGTQDMLQEYDKEYPGKFILNLSEENKGITANSNCAHFACSGKYIAWMGGDDLMLSSKIRSQVEFMENNPECTICYHNLEIFDSDAGKIISYYNSKRKFNGDVRTSIRYGTFNGGCSNMVRSCKTPKNGFNITIPTASDWLYWVETLGNGGTINYIDKVLGRYRRHANNISKKTNFITQNEVDLLNTCNIILSKYPHLLADVMRAYAKRLRGLRHKIDYASILWASIKVKPTMKAIGGLIIYYLSLTKVRL